MKRTIARIGSLALGAALFYAGPLGAQLTVHKYVALGDSYGAGFGAGCLVNREQAFSYPNQLATAFGISGFQQPTVSDPGIPTCIGLKSLSPVSFGPISTKTGAPTNLTLARPYDNLSVPGYKIADVSDKLTDNGGIADLVLRGLGSAQNQALSLSPDFITLGIIGNDILTAGGAGFLLDGVTATPLPLFTAKYNAVAAALKATGRNGVFIGTPNPNLIPLASTLTRFVPDPATGKPILVNGQPIPLLGPGNAAFPCPAAQPACPLPDGTLVTLGASAPQEKLGGKSLLQLGFGIPCAVAPLPRCNNPLPDGSFTPPATVNVGVLLYPDEVANIITRVKDMNSVIQAAATANGFKYFDFYALGTDLIANGRTYGGVHISKDFVTGGMFAFGDAIHMSNVGYTILTDELVQFINSSYGASFPRPNVGAALFTPDSPASGTPAILGPLSPESVLFSEEDWHKLFDVYPLQSSEYVLVFPGGDEADRPPIRRTEPRSRNPVEKGRSPVRP